MLDKEARMLLDLMAARLESLAKVVGATRRRP